MAEMRCTHNVEKIEPLQAIRTDGILRAAEQHQSESIVDAEESRGTTLVHNHIRAACAVDIKVE